MTAYEMRISDWSSDVCSSDLEPHPRRVQAVLDGKVVIDTEQAMIVHRPGRTLTYAFPREVVGGLPSAPEPEASGYVTVPWDARADERRVGKECVGTCSYRW